MKTKRTAEYPPYGLRKKTEPLIDCAAIVTEALFTGEGDEDIRAGFTRELASVTINNRDADVSVMLSHVQKFLRTVKVDRIKRAEKWINYKVLRDTTQAPAAPKESKNKALIHKTLMKQSSYLKMFFVTYWINHFKYCGQATQKNPWAAGNRIF